MQPANAAALPPAPPQDKLCDVSVSKKKKWGKGEGKKPASWDLRQEIKVTQAEDERVGGGG